MLALWCLGLLPFQEPAPTPPAPGATVEAERAPAANAPPVVAWSDKEAKEPVDAFQKALKTATSMADKNRALESVAAGSHKSLVKPLGTLVELDKSVLIRKRAAELLGRQPAADAKPELLRLIGSSRVQNSPPVLATLVTALARSYRPADWAAIDKLFGLEYAEDRVPLQEAVLDLVTQQKEKRAVQLLLDNLDEPTPANVDDATNPPAEYWEARWKSWKVWRGRVKEALFAITGQRFSTAAEARAWLQKNPLK